MLPSIDGVRCFVAAARLLNFRRAARTVGLTPAALGKRIKQLEEQYGVPLFERTTRKVALTEAGLALLPRAQQLLMEAEACVAALQGRGERPVMDLIVGTRHELGLSWLLPMLPDLREAHSQVTFHCYFGSGPDLELRVRSLEIDCAISSRPIQDASIDFFMLHQENYVMVGAPALMSHKPLASPLDCAAHTLIDVLPELPLFHYFQGAQENNERWRFGHVLRMGAIAAIRALVVAGEGVAVLPQYLVADDLACGRLLRLMPERPMIHDHFRLLYRGDDPRRAFFEGFAASLRAAPLK